MRVNPYQVPMSGDGLEDQEADGWRSDEADSMESFIKDWRRRRMRWNVRCYVAASVLILVAIAIGFTSTLFANQNEQLAAMIGWTLLFLLGGAALLFIFGPIAWFWAGQHRP